MANTYSLKDLAGSFTHPDAGTFPFTGGKIGIGQVTIQNATDHTVHDTAGDGGVMVSFVSGDSGSAQIEMQQTSALHAFLLGWFNTVKTNADLGDVSNWAAAALSFRNTVDGSGHVLTGVSPSKVPDKTYAAQGGKVTWSLMAANVVNQ